jgi:hypothetical protein
MAIRNSLLSRFGNWLAFFFTIGMGILSGYVLSASDWTEELSKENKRHIEQTRERR